DAVVAVYITETSKSADSMLGYESVLHKSFSADPTTEYYQHEHVILTHLRPTTASQQHQDEHDDMGPPLTQTRFAAKWKKFRRDDSDTSMF
ncbi:hypothetical protein DYB31_009297, partial [Aphanomyces astaci]